MPYIEGFVAAVPTANKDAYIEQARRAAEYFKKLGATRLVECWGKMSEDTEMQQMEMPFDAKRMFWGGFEQVVDS